MRFERISYKALILWEIVTVICFALAFFGILVVFKSGTWLWYLLLWLCGALLVVTTFLYLPLAYISIEYAIGAQAIIYRKGVIFPNTEVLYRDRIAFVTVYKNPLTPLLHISSLVMSAAGGNMRILFLNSSRAEEIAALLAKE